MSIAFEDLFQPPDDVVAHAQARRLGRLGAMEHDSLDPVAEVAERPGAITRPRGTFALSSKRRQSY